MKNNEVLNKERILEYSNKTFFITSDTLGTLEFRLINGRDNSILIDYLYEFDAENFSKYFLLNQMKNNELSISDLNQLDTYEIEFILKKFIEQDSYLLKNFVFDTDKSFFQNFKENMFEYFLNFEKVSLEYISNIGKMIEPYHSNILSAMESLEDLFLINPVNVELDFILNNQNNINKLQENLLNISSSLQKNLDDINKFTNSLYKINNSISPYMNSIIPEIESISNLVSSMSYGLNLNKILEEQLLFWSNWTNKNQHILDFFNKSLESWRIFSEQYQIKESVAINYLKKYQWFISPSMDISMVYKVIEISNSNSNKKYSEINHLFYNYFIENNCKNLLDMVNSWQNNDIFKNRMKIFRDCIEIIKINSRNFNPSNLVVPVLIAQIEGIQNDFMKSNGLTINRNNVCDLAGNKLKDEDGQIIKKEDYFRDLTSQDEFLDAMNDVFLDVLFQHTMPGDDYKTSIHFSRHKILHGENFRYGRKDYMIRCFMILDFLYELSLN